VRGGERGREGGGGEGREEGGSPSSTSAICAMPCVSRFSPSLSQSPLPPSLPFSSSSLPHSPPQQKRLWSINRKILFTNFYRIFTQLYTKKLEKKQHFQGDNSFLKGTPPTKGLPKKECCRLDQVSRCTAVLMLRGRWVYLTCSERSACMPLGSTYYSWSDKNK